jgi:hypothetical protein
MNSLRKILDKIEDNLDVMERHIPNAEKFHAVYSQDSDSKAGQEARKKFNIAAKAIGDNLSSADTKITDLYQQRAALQTFAAEWTRLSAARTKLANLKPKASAIRLNAQDV